MVKMTEYEKLVGCLNQIHDDSDLKKVDIIRNGDITAASINSLLGGKNVQVYTLLSFLKGLGFDFERFCWHYIRYCQRKSHGKV